MVDSRPLIGEIHTGSSEEKPFWLVTLLLCIAYVISGKLSLLLAIPPGYASAIFPPAGIAVAVAFVAHKRPLPGIFLGSLLLNLWIGYESSQQLSIIGVSAAFLIAVASTVQARVGGWCLRRVIGYPASFDNVRDVLCFQLLTPASCMVSATLSITSLVCLGVIPLSSAPISWAVWWGGDTLGVLVLLPLMLIAIGEPRKLWNKRVTTVALPMLLAFTLLVVLYINVSKWEQAESLVEFRLESQRLADNIQSRMDEQELLLEQTKGFFLHDGNVTSDEFHRFTQEALQRFPMIRAIEWAPQIDAQHRHAFEATQQAYHPGYQIREYHHDGVKRSASQHDILYPITYREPQADNQAVIGFDLASSPERRKAVEEAIQTGKTVATVPLNLLLQSREQSGVLLIHAIPTRSGNSDVVLTVIRIGDFMNKLMPAEKSVLCVRLIDVGTRQTVYNSFLIPNKPALLRQQLLFGGRHYRLETAPSPTYLAHHRGWQSAVVLAAGILGTGLLGAFLMLGSGHTARVEAQVEERTAALKESDAKTREITAALGEGVYVVDKYGRITFSNPEAQRLLGWSELEMLGSKAHSLFHYMRADGTFFPPEACEMAHTLHSRNTYRGETTFWSHDGSPLPVEVCATPIVRDGTDVGAVIVFRDISERKALEAKLYHQAFYDPLTDLPNRRFFLDCLQQAISRAKRSNKGMAVLFMDMDGFKHINDTYGHEAGDRVLQLFALRLTASVREADIVARLGGDEFTIILEGLNNPYADAQMVAQKIIEKMSETVTVAGHSFAIETSIGVTVFNPRMDQNADAILSKADAAMYQAKQSGKNQIAYK